jgi:hypothetical protein
LVRLAGVTDISGRIVAFDTAVALCCTKLHVPDHDAIISATELVHGMTVVTRNVTDFVTNKVGLLNPWE